MGKLKAMLLALTSYLVKKQKILETQVPVSAELPIKLPKFQNWLQYQGGIGLIIWNEVKLVSTIPSESAMTR